MFISLGEVDYSGNAKKYVPRSAFLQPQGHVRAYSVCRCVTTNDFLFSLKCSMTQN